MPKKVTDIVAYLSPIGFVIAFLVGDRENCKFHLNQALVLTIISLALQVLSKIASIIPLIGGIIGLVISLISLLLFVLWLMGIIGAIQGQEKEIPLIGHIKLIS